MIPRIRELLDAAPFRPFTIRTSDGRKYLIPTADHAAVNPKATRLVVFLNGGGQIDLAGLHVAAVSRSDEVQK